MEINYYLRVERTPAYAFLVEAWSELNRDRDPSDYTAIYHSTRALLAFKDGQAAGIISYTHDPEDKSYQIVLGYVAPEFRRQGIYQLLWTELAARARSDLVMFINSHIRTSNQVMCDIALSQGRTELYVYSQLKLET